ncbi:MAG TPA: hypothetical protein VFA97_06895 [Gaiellaceae bacterium]|nr:hypothetical protein [Gaiellaceae bacterium]
MARVALLAATLGSVLAALLPASANASVPCRDRIYNDWYKDGKIASTYPISCYRDALKHVPADALTYSSLGDDIRAAMQGALARLHGKKNVPSQIGSGGGASSPTSNVKHLKKPGSSTQPSQGPNPKTGSTSTVAVSSSSGSGGGVPTPIIVLGALALVLVAAGGVGAGVRHYRRR